MAYFLSIVLVILSVALGALGGRWLVFRRLDRELFSVVANARASAERANKASATVEAIAPAWPEVLERVEKLDGIVRRFTRDVQAAERLSRDTAARQDELEQAVASNFSITLTRGGTT